MKRKQGFTLLEILVAISIIIVITAIGVVSYSQINKKARDTRRTSDLEQLRQALEMYRSDNGYYPAVNPSFGNITALQGTLVTTGQYMPALPTDPKTGDPNRFYRYIALNGPINGQYYGYCICAEMENTPANSGTCTGTALPSPGCNYGMKNP